MEIPELYFLNAPLHVVRNIGTLHPAKAPISVRKRRVAPASYDEVRLNEFTIIVGSSLLPPRSWREAMPELVAVRDSRLCSDPSLGVERVFRHGIHALDRILGRPRMEDIKYVDHVEWMLPISERPHPSSSLSTSQSGRPDYSYGFVSVDGFSGRLVQTHLDRQFPQCPYPFVGRRLCMGSVDAPFLYDGRVR